MITIYLHDDVKPNYLATGVLYPILLGCLGNYIYPWFGTGSVALIYLSAIILILYQKS
ncbi:hypothetical protein [Neisseria sp. Ec49-e6-T10]|uniref:hypothetical protein n=1 Tax=Neisseria sp. Ec49-e6-T10 TaxID=3140744 RepID=UPI003EB9C51B